MEKYVLNETPVRTANNFGINNIEVILDIPKYKAFDNFNLITDDLSKVDVEILDNIKIKENNKINLERLVNYTVKIKVADNIKINNTIKLEFNFDDDNEFLVEDIDIILGKDAEANFEIVFTSETSKNMYHNGQIKTNLSDGAKSKIILANLINQESDSIYAIENNLNMNSKLQYDIVEIGGRNKISNYYSKLIGDNAENLLNIIYLGKENDVLDINYNMETYGKNSKAYINVQGAITDNAKKSFKGTINFKEGCKKAIGKENENCLILSNTAKSKSLPMLLCHEEDVEGEHGVSSGKINENMLFYIMTKGISYNEARKLIIKANFNEILNNISDEEISKKISNEIDKI